MMEKFRNFVDDLDVESANSPNMLLVIGFLVPMISLLTVLSKGFGFMAALAVSYLCLVTYSGNVKENIEESSNGRTPGSDPEA